MNSGLHFKRLLEGGKTFLGTTRQHPEFRKGLLRDEGLDRGGYISCCVNSMSAGQYRWYSAIYL